MNSISLHSMVLRELLDRAPQGGEEPSSRDLLRIAATGRTSSGVLWWRISEEHYDRGMRMLLEIRRERHERKKIEPSDRWYDLRRFRIGRVQIAAQRRPTATGPKVYFRVSFMGGHRESTSLREAVQILNRNLSYEAYFGSRWKVIRIKRRPRTWHFAKISSVCAFDSRCAGYPEAARDIVRRWISVKPLIGVKASDGSFIGIRRWTTSVGWLHSPFRGTRWNGPTLVAEEWSSSTKVRSAGGIHAAWPSRIPSPHGLFPSGFGLRSAWGQVRGFGEVVWGNLGWRAERCIIDWVVVHPLAQEEIQRNYPEVEVLTEPPKRVEYAKLDRICR